MAATVTGEECAVYIAIHSGNALPSNYLGTTKKDNFFGMGEFSLTLDRGTIEQDLIASAGNYFDQGALTMDGSFTMTRFGSSGNSDVLLSIIDGSGKNQYFCISGRIADDTTSPALTHLKWFLVSCQVTGYDVSVGDASTITEASIDFIVMDTENIEYTTGLISDRVKA